MADSRLCSIPDCGKKVRSKGLCNPHYLRLITHGDPCAGGPLRERNHSGICSVPQCGKPYSSFGFCYAHWSKFRKYGDPLAGYTLPAKDELPNYYHNVVLKYEGSSCLYWPYYTGGKGYGQIEIDGQRLYVHRLVCEAVNGPPPTPEHQAAHSCGKGHLGCVARNHLRWATRIENEADKILHGTRIPRRHKP